MKKQAYSSPALSTICVAGTSMIASTVRSAAGNAELTYGGGSTGSARVKENSYNVWDDDWSE